MANDARKARDTRSTAEKLRAHRAAFELALELRITPAAAQDILNERARTAASADAQARHAASTRALHAKMHAPLPRALTDPEPPRGPWWDRD